MTSKFRRSLFLHKATPLFCALVPVGHIWATLMIGDYGRLVQVSEAACLGVGWPGGGRFVKMEPWTMLEIALFNHTQSGLA